MESKGRLVERPRILFVDVPPLLAKTTTLLKTPATFGANWIRTLVEVVAARLKGEPETTSNAPASKVAEPFRMAPPALLTTKLAWAVTPVTQRPKSRTAGATESRGIAFAIT